MRGGGGLLAYQAAKALSPTGRGQEAQPVVVRRGDDIFGSSSHPRTWEQFIGQERVKQQLLVAIHAAGSDTRAWVEHVGQERAAELLGLVDPFVDEPPVDGEPAPRAVPHILLAAGQGGVGKTSLAKLVGATCQTDYTELGGKLTDGDIVNALQALGHFGVLFIDEIHRLAETRGKGQVLLTYMESRRLFLDGADVPVSPLLTIIGATTEAGLLKGPLRQRFVLCPALGPYSDAEAALIVRQLAGKLGFGGQRLPMPSEAGWFEQVAVASNKTARVMTRILTQVRDLAVVAGNSSGRYDLAEALEMLGIYPDGMTVLACEYLRVLHGSFGGQAGGESIANTMSEPGGLVETEELLVAKRLLAKTQRGRKLTPTGTRYAQQLTKVA